MLLCHAMLCYAMSCHAMLALAAAVLDVSALVRPSLGHSGELAVREALCEACWTRPATGSRELEWPWHDLCIILKRSSSSPSTSSRVRSGGDAIE